MKTASLDSLQATVYRFLSRVLFLLCSSYTVGKSRFKTPLRMGEEARFSPPSFAPVLPFPPYLLFRFPYFDKSLRFHTVPLPPPPLFAPFFRNLSVSHESSPWNCPTFFRPPPGRPLTSNREKLSLFCPLCFTGSYVFDFLQAVRPPHFSIPPLCRPLFAPVNFGTQHNLGHFRPDSTKRAQRTLPY